MSSKINDFLHELIHSLTKSEKRYFKLLSSRHTIGDENNYIVIFDFIDKQEVYDEHLLKIHFAGESFLNKLSITKKRLYDHILNALDNFHSQSNIESQIFKMIHCAEILSAKSLYNQSNKLLLRAEKLAEKNELSNLIIHIRCKLKDLLEKNNYLDIQPTQLEEIKSKDEHLHKLSLIETRLWNIKSQLFQHMALHGIARSEKDKMAYFEIYNPLQEIPILDSSTAEISYLINHIRSAYFFSIQEMDKSFEALQNNISLFQNTNNLIKNHPGRYFSILTNSIYAAQSLNLFDFSEMYLLELKELENDILSANQNLDLQVKLFSSVASIELSLYTQKGDYDAARLAVDKIETGFKLYGNSISPIRKAYLWFKIASIHLAKGEPNLALKAIRKILNDVDLDKKEDIVSFSHLLELFIYIDLGDLDYLGYATRTTKRFLSSRNRLFEFEKELIGFVSKYATTKNHFDQIERWEILYKKLIQLTKDPYQASGLEYFDFVLWAESKILNKSFVELSRSKFLQKLKNAA